MSNESESLTEITIRPEIAVRIFAKLKEQSLDAGQLLRKYNIETLLCPICFRNNHFLPIKNDYQTKKRPE